MKKTMMLAMVLGTMAGAVGASADSVAPRECGSWLNYGAHVLSIGAPAGGQLVEIAAAPLAVDWSTLNALAQAAGVGEERIEALVATFGVSQCRVARRDSQVFECDTFSGTPPLSHPIGLRLRLQGGREVAVGMFTGRATVVRIRTLGVDREGTDYKLQFGFNGDGDNHSYIFGEKDGLDCR